MFTGTITGTVGRDPEAKYFESGSAVATFTVAVRERRKRVEGEEALWIKVKVWGKSVEWVADNIKKGDQVTCTGEIARPEQFSRRDGTAGFVMVLDGATVEKPYLPRESGAPAPTVAAPAPATAPAVSSDEIPF